MIETIFDDRDGSTITPAWRGELTNNDLAEAKRISNMTNWDEVVIPSEGAGGTFFKLSDGESKVVCIADERPKFKQLVWLDGKSEVYNPKEHAGEKVSTRACLRLYVDGSWKIWETSLRNLEVVKKYGQKNKLPKFQFEIERTGTGVDTKYSFIQDEAIDDDLRQAMKESAMPEFQDVIEDAASGVDLF